MDINWEMVSAIANVVIALAVGVSALRYFFVAKMPLNLKADKPITGESYKNGKLVSSHYSFQYCLKNYGKEDVLISKMVLKRKPKWAPNFWPTSWWCSVPDAVDGIDLPDRLAGEVEKRVIVTIEQVDAGMHNLIVNEYGSWRSAKFKLLELDIKAAHNHLN